MNSPGRMGVFRGAEKFGDTFIVYRVEKTLSSLIFKKEKKKEVLPSMDER